LAHEVLAIRGSRVPTWRLHISENKRSSFAGLLADAWGSGVRVFSDMGLVWMDMRILMYLAGPERV
jgi:hypothetical protein